MREYVCGYKERKRKKEKVCDRLEHVASLVTGFMQNRN